MHARAYVIPCPWHSRSKLCTWPAQSSLREIQAHGKMLDDGWPFTCLAKSIGKRIRTLPTRRIGYPSTRVPPSNIAHARFETCKCKDRGATLNKTKGTMALECCSPWHRLTGPPAPPAPPCRSLRRGGLHFRHTFLGSAHASQPSGMNGTKGEGVPSIAGHLRQNTVGWKWLVRWPGLMIPATHGEKLDTRHHPQDTQ